MKHTQGEIHITKIDAGIFVAENNGGSDLFKMYDGVHSWREQQEANADRMIALWNAANGMPTEEAVKYIEHGREMGIFLISVCSWSKNPNLVKMASEMLTKLEAK